MKQLLTLTFLSLLGIVHAQIPSYVPTNGLVGWWPFNGNANDESGNGNNGTVNGATLTLDRNGVANCAYGFDGVNDNIVVSTININSLDYSLSCWVNLNVAYNTNFPQHYIICWGCSTNGAYFNIDVDQIQFCCGNVSISQNTNEWNYFSIVKNNGTVSLYKNGILIQNSVNNLLSINSINNLYFGSTNINSEFTNGLIDDIGIWNRALTECEIQDLYHAQVGFTTVDAGQDQTICRGTEVTLNGAGGNFLSWNNSVVNGVPFAPNQTSSYILTGADSLGCVGTDTVLVTVLDNASSTINQTAIDSYTLNGQTYTQSGTYTQVLTAANGCDSTITLNLDLDFTGIQTNTLTSLKLYPNPVQDVLQIDGLAGKEFEYEVLSIEGKLLQKGKSQGEIAVKELKKGNYVLRIGQQQVAFVKQ